MVRVPVSVLAARVFTKGFINKRLKYLKDKNAELQLLVERNGLSAGERHNHQSHLSPFSCLSGVCVFVCEAVRGLSHQILLNVNIWTTVNTLHQTCSSSCLPHTLFLSLCFIDRTGFKPVSSKQYDFSRTLTRLTETHGSRCVAQIVL